MKKLTLFKGQAMAWLILFFLFIGQGCKKEILLQKDNNSIISSKIRTISYQEFINSINIKATGSLSTVLTGAKEKVMSSETLAGNLNLVMDSVKLLHLGDTLSYIISIKPQTPRATVFQNLTIQVVKEKTTAFLSTYYPSTEWIERWRAGHVIAFKDKVEFNKIYLNDVGLNTKSLNTTKDSGLKGKILASISSPSGMPNVISLAPGECEIYDIYTVVPHQCSTGDWPGSCPWELTGIPTEGGSLPYYTLERTSGVNCAPPAAGSGSEGGGSSSGGGTVPTPPPGYNPCNGGTPSVSFNFERGTRLAGLPPTPCDPIMPEGADPSISSNAQYLFNILSISDENRKNFIKSHNEVTNDLVAYLSTNGPTTENKDFVIWAISYLIANPSSYDDFKRDFLTQDIGLDTSDLGTSGTGQDMKYSIYFDDVDGSFKPISESDPNYNNVINNGTTVLPMNFAPCTTQALRQMGKDKGWDVGVSSLEFNRRVGQAFQEAVFKLYNQKLLPPQRARVTYQPHNNVSAWRKGQVGNSGKVIPDWTYDVNFMGVSVPFSQHWFYDAKAVTGTLYLSSSKFQIGGYLDVLSKKKVPNAPPPAMVFVTPVNTIISPSIIATAINKGVQVRQAFVIIINNQLYLLNSIQLTSTNDKFTNIPTNMLKILSGPVDLEWPANPNTGPDFEEVQ